MMRRNKRRLAALLLALGLTAGLVPAQAAEGADTPLTRGQVRDMLVAAADDYNPGVTAGQVLQGRADGDLDEDDTATRIEALVMLVRAFGPFPALTGENARAAYPTPDFTDVPDWAAEELEPLFQAGLVTGTSSTTLSPDAPMTQGELEVLLERVYALEGSCLQDDFYAAVNRDWLEDIQIPLGYSRYTTIHQVDYQTGQQVLALIEDVADSQPQDGTAQDRVKTLYENILDWDSRDAQGAAPIQSYLDAIRAATTLDGLMEVHNQICAQLALPTLLAFSVTTDAYNAGQAATFFGLYAPTMDASFYGDEDACAALTDYISTLFTLTGYSEEEAGQAAQRILELEGQLADASLSAEEQADVTNTYNVVDAQALADLFPQVDLDSLRQACGLQAADTYVLGDMGQAEFMAGLFTPEHLEDLKLMAQVCLLTGTAASLSRDFVQAQNDFLAATQGTTAAADQETAMKSVRTLLYNDLGPLYIDSYFSAQAKADVTALVEDIVDAYAQRIQALDWMSDTTKAKALEKLDAIGINVGYPDQWNNWLEGVDFRSTDEGGSFFENAVAINLAQRTYLNSFQGKALDLSIWDGVPVYEVNAFYSPTDNAIVLPAGILQAPLYDVTASFEENLGAIGYIIAHEITHAFDNNGAMFDAQGAMNNWWTDEDYAAFQALCQQVIDFYDGLEAVPGITCNGSLTLSENVADLGAAACITQILADRPDPDFQTLYTQMATVWRSAASRDARVYLAAVDVHAPDKLRANRVLQSLDMFYTAFDIQPGDGMWLDPEERVSVW